VTDSGTSARRPRLSAEERRDQIVASAHRVFARRGLAGARTRDIAEEAGVNEALVYQHFRSKSELFEAVLVSALRDAENRLDDDLREALPQDHLDADGVKNQMTRQVSRLIVAFTGIEPLLGVVLYGDDEVASTHFREHLNSYLLDTRRALEDFLPHWSHSEFDPQLAVEALIGIIWTRVLIGRLSDREMDLDVEARAIAELMLDGLLAR
jgi:AcrR family transcriptional regulator